MKTTTNFPRGIEVVCTALIENPEKKILLCQSPKWQNRWVMPGGHINPGETILDAAKRESEEETGLIIKPIKILYTPNSSELIAVPEFHREAHFINFDVYCQSTGGMLTIDGLELTTFKWVTPKQALAFDLAPGYKETILAYIGQVLK